METTTQQSGIASWTPEQEARIEHFQQTTGCSRVEAVKKMRAEEKKAAKPAQVVSAAQLTEQQRALDAGINKELTGTPQPTAKPQVDRKATRKAHAKAERHAAPKAKAAKKDELTPQKQSALDRLIREAAGKDAIDRMLKSSMSPKYTRYQFWGTANGNVVNCNIDAGTAKLMDEKSTTVKKWRRQLARELKAGEAKLAKAAKKAEAK